MKQVHVVEFGCKLISEELDEETARELKKRLEDKGLQCSLRDVEKKPE